MGRVPQQSVPEYKIAPPEGEKRLNAVHLKHIGSKSSDTTSLQAEGEALDTTDTPQTKSSALCILHRSDRHMTVAFQPFTQTRLTTLPESNL
jgi:hypothetical protein